MNAFPTGYVISAADLSREIANGNLLRAIIQQTFDGNYYVVPQNGVSSNPLPTDTENEASDDLDLHDAIQRSLTIQDTNVTDEYNNIIEETGATDEFDDYLSEANDEVNEPQNNEHEEIPEVMNLIRVFCDEITEEMASGTATIGNTLVNFVDDVIHYLQRVAHLQFNTYSLWGFDLAFYTDILDENYRFMMRWSDISVAATYTRVYQRSFFQQFVNTHAEKLFLTNFSVHFDAEKNIYTLTP